MQRLAWKEALIERVDQRIHAEPVAAPARAAWPSVSAENSEYLKVRLTGKYLHDKQAFVQGVTVRGPGYWVMTPLQTEGGDIVLVNRGFVPQSRSAPPAAGVVTVTGLLRMSETGKQFLRENEPAADRWYARNVDAIAAARELGSVAPYFVDLDAAAGTSEPDVPMGGLTVVSFRNSHLQYALTWFALAMMVAGGAFLVFRHEWRLRKTAPE